VDPDGFLIAELDGAPAATISCVNYSASFAFLGFYIVREDLRGRGHGLRIWNAAIAHAGHDRVARALVRDGRFAAWGVIRPCWMGNKIGPLVGDDRDAVEAVLAALVASSTNSEIFLDVPSINRDAIAVAEDLGLAPVFEIPSLRLERVFGVTTLELG